MANILHEAAERAKKIRADEAKREARWAEIQAGYEACDVLMQEAYQTWDEHTGQPRTDLEKLQEAQRMKAALAAIERDEFGEPEKPEIFDRPHVASRPGPASIEDALTDPSEWRELDTTTASPENAKRLRRQAGIEREDR